MINTLSELKRAIDHCKNHHAGRYEAISQWIEDIDETVTAINNDDFYINVPNGSDIHFVIVKALLADAGHYLSWVQGDAGDDEISQMALSTQNTLLNAVVEQILE